MTFYHLPDESSYHSPVIEDLERENRVASLKKDFGITLILIEQTRILIGGPSKEHIYIPLSNVVIEQQRMLYCKGSHLVRGVVKLKVVIAHAKEAEVVIPKNPHLQNSTEID